MAAPVDVEVGGRRHSVRIDGSGGPTVVLEPAIADIGLTWALVQPQVARFATAFTHDGPGLGHGEPSGAPRTVAVMADELRSVLEAVGMGPPFLLVGHSFASLTVRYFAHTHPEETGGVVLVDGAHEDQMERFPPELDPRRMLAGYARGLRQMAEQAQQSGAVPDLTPPPAAFPPALQEEYRAAAAPTPSRLRTAAAEYEALSESQAQVRALRWRMPGDIPVVALRHGLPQPVPGVADEVNRAYEETWQALQEELAARSRRGRVEVAAGAGHMIHHERPELVVEAVRELVDAMAG